MPLCRHAGWLRRHGPSSPAGGRGPRDRLVFAAAADATTLDPHNTTDTESDQVIMMVYEPLLAFDDTMKIVPRLAERYDVDARRRDLDVPPASGRDASTTARRSTPRP